MNFDDSFFVFLFSDEQGGEGQESASNTSQVQQELQQVSQCQFDEQQEKSSNACRQKNGDISDLSGAMKAVDASSSSSVDASFSSSVDVGSSSSVDYDEHCSRQKKEAIGNDAGSQEKSESIEKEENSQEKYESIEKEENSQEKYESIEKEENSQEKSESVEKEENSQEKSESIEKDVSSHKKSEPADKELSSQERESIDKEENSKRKSESVEKEHSNQEKSGSLEKEGKHCSDNERKDQSLVPDEVSSSDSLCLSNSATATTDSEKESNSKCVSPVCSASVLPSESEKSGPSNSDDKKVFAIQGNSEYCKESIAVNTEPIREVLKEILRVSPGRASSDTCDEDKQRIDKSSSCSPSSLKNESRAEQNSAGSHSIAFDDPAIVTSSDVCINNSTRATVPSEGDGSAHIMNLLRKSLQNDLVNKGDGDTVFEKAGTENQGEKVSVGRTRTDSSTSTSTASAETGIVGEPTTRREERPVREMLVRRQASQTNMPASDKPVLETLTFGTSLDYGDEIIDNVEDTTPRKVADRSCPCPLCDRSYPADNKEDVLAHLVLVHKFVIADVNFIGNLSV